MVLQLVILFLKKIIKKNMNYKIRITAENQAIVKRIADENGMNPFGYLFKNHGKSYTVINNKFDNIWVENATELTTEQFIELFDKKETLAGRWFQALKDNVASSQIVKGQFYLIEKEDDKLIFFKVPTFEDTEWLFKLNKEVHKNEFKLMPKDFQLIQETDFKTKVIELIETKINDLKGYEKRQIERNEYYNNHSQVASKIKVYNDLINQIKQL